ncbi:MAG: GNAT family N-acetyltransferase [Candidatus Omnitrophota bacterium]|nr:GNAT family N-acetyltransferase [Candidatus Omnitrophota bacterium]
MQITIVKDTEGFKDLEKEWDSFLDESGQNNIFLTFDWLYNWWQCFKKDYSLYIILAKENDKIYGIAPLMISKRFGFRELRFISSNISDYEDIITSGSTEKRREIIEIILNKLYESNEWDIFRLNRIRQESPSLSSFDNIVHNRIFANIFLKQHKEGAPYIKITKTWDDYHSALRKKLVADTRRQLSKLTKQDANFLFKKIENESEISLFLDKLIEFYKLRRKSKHTKCIFDNGLTSSFIKIVADKFFHKGWLDLSFMEFKGKKVAMHFGFIYRDRFYYFMPVHNNEFYQYSPGRLLLYDLIHKCFDNHIRQFDFMLGEEDYKLDWKTGIERLYFVTMFQKTLKGSIANQILDRLSFNVKKLLGKKW